MTKTVTSTREITTEQRAALEALGDAVHRAFAPWRVHLEPGVSRQMARARWRRAAKEARYSAEVKRAQTGGIGEHRAPRLAPVDRRFIANGFLSAVISAARRFG